MKAVCRSLKSGDTLLAVDELNEARRKLIDLLENNDSYNADQVLSEFESGDWIEEKTCLLARLGRHKQVSFYFIGKFL